MFTPLAMGTNHMLGQDAYVPITTNNFEIRVYNLDGSSPAEFSQILTLSTDEIGDIQEEQDIITVHYGNGVIKFPSKVTFADTNWTLNCFCKPNVLDALREWRKKVFDWETQKMGLPSDYMKNVYFIRYDGQGNARDILKAPNVWLGGVNWGGNNQQGGELVKIQVPFIISHIEYLKPEDIM